MKVFIDTNIFAEYIFERVQFEVVQKIFNAIKEKRFEAITSSGTFYTLAFITEQMLKRKGIHRPQQTGEIRRILSSMLGLVHVGRLTHRGVVSGVNDGAFVDIEDSFQFRCAKENLCKVFVTINTADFKNVKDEDLEVLSPQQFFETYMAL